MGLPLSGKSTWIRNNLKDGYHVVSADDIKEAHPSYDPNNAEALHAYSVKEAEKEMMLHSDYGHSIIMDTGGINRSYTMRIIKNLKSKEYNIKLVHVHTPYNICLERNNLRVRKVPEHAILKKAVKETSQFHRLSEVVNNVEVVEYYTNKHIFIDMDGVIAAMSTLPIVNGEIDFVNAEVHRFLKPVPQMISKLRELERNGHKLYILSAIPNSFSLSEKQEWLDKYFFIEPKRRFFVNQGRHKAEMLENLTEHLKLDKRDVMMIDDIHSTLYDVQAREMNCMHVSEFLAHKF